jgi:cell division protein FtsI/penicillin-binding protein 2
MPYVNLNSYDQSRKKDKKNNNFKKSFLIIILIIISFLIFQISRQFYLFTKLEEQYKELKSKQVALEKEHSEKNEILKNLEKKLEKRGVGVTDDTFYQMDIHNIP